MLVEPFGSGTGERKGEELYIYRGPLQEQQLTPAIAMIRMKPPFFLINISLFAFRKLRIEHS